MKPIPYGRQNITDEDILAVVDVLRSDFLTQGPQIADFENAFANYVGSKYAVAVSNGTAALHLSALALNTQPGNRVITTAISFAATANCVRYCGGDIVFADIDPKTYLLDIDQVRKLLQSSPRGTYQGVIPVDFAGAPVNMEVFRELADEYNLWIIEDACHAPGGYFTDSKGLRQNCGNANYADLAIFSFHPVKHFACGEGGMVTTNSLELYKKLLLLRTHGITKEQDLFQNSSDFARGMLNEMPILDPDSFPAWYYEMQVLGYNYRLTDFQAALGLSQLKRAEEGLKRRKEIAERYFTAFKDLPSIKGQSGYSEEHAFHLYIIEVENRLGLYEYLRKLKIFAQIHYIPIHLMPYYKALGWKVNDLPHAETYYQNCLSLPMFPTLKDEEQTFVIDNIKSFFEQK